MKSCFLHCLLVSGFLFCLQVTKAQNLAPNPGFEEYDPCPDDWGNGGSLQSSPWQNGNLATSDYFNTCATGTNVWVPDNFAGSQTAHSGNGYVGFYIREASVWREYIQAPLLSPLIAGTTYHVSFYLSLADNYCATSNIGAFFSAVPPDPANNIGTLNATPQVEANVGFINNTGEWMLITGCFVAQGGEQWVTIGNFYNNANTPLEPGCSTSFASYYYLDDVSVEAGDPAEEIELDLEDDVTTCASSFTINSGVSNVDYHWSTGETTPNITVTESDEYFLTITSGCASAVDSITVTFETSAQVQLGPPGLSLCQGETFYASLDPALGIYTWQDGSHNPVYTVTTPGIYSVTLENACGTSSDVIEILYTNIPAGFSLGDDVSICQGEEISFSFDPALGQFTWQDGSHSHEYTITAPGVYSLTISNECGSVSDQIIVTQSAGPQVDLGPSEVTFCDNEEISIDFNFDTQLGDFLWQDGSTGAAYHIDAPGIYSVTVTNACGMSDDEITVFAASAPAQFSLGDDAEICSGEIIEYNFDSALGDFEWQDQSTSSSYTISSGGVYHLTISNGCGAVSDTITVTEHTAPQINLGQDATLCEGESIVISLDPVLGEFLWQDGSTLSDYTISQAGVYSVTVTNSCGQNEDAREIFVVHSFPLELGSDIIVCPAALPVTLDVSTANATNYTWQDNSTQPVYQAMASGTYAVTVSNECFEKSDQINVIVEDSAPVVTLPDDLTLCPGDTLTLTAGNLQGEFLWQDQSQESSFEVIASGTYSLQVSNDCGVGTDTVNVVFENPLTPPDLGDDLVLCEGTTYTLHLTADGNNIRWQDGSNADSMIVDHAGMYFAEIFNACSSATDTIIVTIDNDPPVLDFQDTILLCAGQTLQINPGISGVDFVWSTGASSAVIDVTLPGTYILTVSNDCGSDIDTTVILASENLPNDFLPDSLTICNGESQLLSPAFQSAISYLWHDGVNTPSHPVTGSGWYVLQMTYTCAVLSDSCYVSMIEAPVQFDLGNDTLLCASGFIQLTLPANTSDYIWQDGSIGNFYLISNSGVYSVEVKNQCGSISDTITVTDGPPAPVLDLGPDQSLCPGETIIFDPGISGVSYLWHNGSDESQFSATTPGTLSLTVDNICGSWTDTVIVFSDTSGPSVELGDSISSCAGKEVVLHANVSGVEYKWHDGSTGQDLTVTSTGLYAVTVSNACGEDSDRVFVDFLTSEPVVQLGIDTILCEGDTYTLLGSGNPGHEYLWNDGSAASSLEVIAAGQYFLTETNQCGSASDTILIDFYHRPPDFYLGPDTTVCDDADFILSSPSTPDIITWQDGSHSTEIVVNQSLTYRLEISNACGTVSDEITIDVVNCNATQDVYFPNAFSPNFDGGNDVFQISFSPGAQPSEFVMNIFDRWGNEVFHTNDPQQCWDGSFKGSLLSPGVYTYIATFRLNGIVQQHAGDITLVR